MLLQMTLFHSFLKLINLLLTVLVFIVVHRLFYSCSKRGLISNYCGFSLWRLLLQNTGSRAHSLSSRGSWAQEHRLRSWAARTWLHHSMWDFPKSGIKHVSLALADRFFTTGPPGKPYSFLFYGYYYIVYMYPIFFSIYLLMNTEVASTSWLLYGIEYNIPYDEQCSYEHWLCRYLFEWVFSLFQIYTQEWSCWSIW